MASKWISKLARSQPPSASPHSLDYGLQSLHNHGLPSAYLQSRSVTASKCISKLPRFWSRNLHDHGLQVHLLSRSITIPECIFKFPQSRPLNVSPNSLDYHLHVHPITRSITASECISDFTRSSFPGAPRTCSQAPCLQPVLICGVDR